MVAPKIKEAEFPQSKCQLLLVVTAEAFSCVSSGASGPLAS